MKKSLLALAALTAFAGVASAQSSVTLFGVADLNMRSVKNDTASIKSLSTDGNSSSRLGVRGTEDLGGGLRAGFWIEAGLSLDNGTAGGGNGGATANAAGSAVAGNSAPSAASGAFFNRRSTVSLLGGFGEIRLGRDYTPTFWNHTIFDPFGTNGVASQTNIISPAPTVAPTGTTQTLVRANNSVGYFLPGGLGGIYGQIMIAAGENQPLGNKYQGFRVGYASGPVNVAGAYGVTKKAGAMDGDLKAMNLGGSWNLGFLVLMGQYHSYKQSSVNELTNMMIGATVPVGAGTFKASYGKTDRKLAGGAEPGATQLGLGYTHDLSKRTLVYGHFSRVSNDAGLGYTAGVGGPAMTAGKDSTGYEFGVRHSF